MRPCVDDTAGPNSSVAESSQNTVSRTRDPEGSVARAWRPRRRLIYVCSRAAREERHGQLIYVANVSLDGYIEDAHGSFEWTAPTDEVFSFITDLVRPVGTYLYGRRMYETMAVWETDPTLAAQSELRADFANVWRAADKIVYSTTLHGVSTANTRLERRFDPDSIRDIKASAAGDLTVGGPTLAAHAFNAGLVDECQLFMYPVLVDEGKPAFPSDAHVELELLDAHRFGNGVVSLRYRTLS
jgi:dihydrofolate reductase